MPCPVLTAAGLTTNNLLKVTTYLSDRRHADANARVRREMLGDHRPALTVVITGI
jgi:2-iminobutanoate/2-iminopropanoate deaminase